MALTIALILDAHLVTGLELRHFFAQADFRTAVLGRHHQAAPFDRQQQVTGLEAGLLGAAAGCDRLHAHAADIAVRSRARHHDHAKHGLARIGGKVEGIRQRIGRSTAVLRNLGELAGGAAQFVTRGFQGRSRLLQIGFERS